MRQEYFDNTPAPTFTAAPVHTECQKCTTGTILYNYNRFSSAFLGFLHSIKGALTYGIQSSFSEWIFLNQRHVTSFKFSSNTRKKPFKSATSCTLLHFNWLPIFIEVHIIKQAKLVFYGLGPAAEKIGYLVLFVKMHWFSAKWLK